MADLLVTPLVALPGGWELVLIVLVIVLLFGAKKLPELARNTGRSLRIFKAETKGLMDDDDDEDEAPKATSPRALDAPGAPASPHGDPLRPSAAEEQVGERRDGAAG
ncbi:Sec-independent protein translocase subunit TatA [Nocardioides perillae]|uniref:Sec-independent protein translocase protein TatA n=1 Tax=Nocardioides perillae TaxID=1119534 RepID=A0A7Y9RXG5_9ACTN|nr:Sec-independent protein translocase subunit TatA [Nocardioides perillae]NYG55869.1 sec-independent protein translocase protein TatA [Nocardioides perillae]